MSFFSLQCFQQLSGQKKYQGSASANTNEVMSRVSLLKSFGAQVSDILEAPKLIFLTEEDLIERWHLLAYQSRVKFSKVTGPMLMAVVYKDGWKMTRRKLTTFLSLTKGELSFSDYLKKQFNLSEEQLQRELKKTVLRQKSQREMQKQIDLISKKLEVLQPYKNSLTQVSGIFQVAINPKVSPQQIQRRLWTLWYHNMDFSEFPFELLNCQSDERFQILLDLYRHNGCCSTDQVWNMFEKHLSPDDNFLAIWGYQFVKMSPLRGKANLIFLIDKGFHLRDIVNSAAVATESLTRLSPTVDVVKEYSIDLVTVNNILSEEEGEQIYSRKMGVPTVTNLFGFLSWKGKVNTKIALLLNLQSLETLLGNYTFLRHVGFTETDLRVVPGILSFNRAKVIQKLERLVRYGECAHSSDNIYLLNYIQYELEKENNFRETLIN